MGYHVRMEERTSDGRIDILLETPRYIYIFEFKIDSTAAYAVKQIREKEYWVPYIHSGKEIYLIGTSFSTKKRTLYGVRIEKP